MTILRSLTPARAATLVLIGALAPLAVALAAQYWGGLYPCVLCIYQRWALLAAGLLAAPAIFLETKPKAARLFLALAGLAALVGAGIAVFHVGVERHWWQGTVECTTQFKAGMTAQEFEAAILAAPVVRCDEVAWSLFGISMAGYNVLYSGALAAFALWQARRH
ncbi:MAG: disulfide bond formation protein B [Pseudomonadota bacterium]